MATLRTRHLLRPAGFDELGLRRAISDRMLPFLVAAMAFLAALAVAGWVGAASLGAALAAGAGAALTVQVPQPKEPAAQGAGSRTSTACWRCSAGTPGVADAHALSDDELGDLLRPWLGSGAERLALPLPAVDRGAAGGRRAANSDRLAAPPGSPPPPAPWSRATASGSAGWPRWRAACRPVPASRCCWWPRSPQR